MHKFYLGQKVAFHPGRGMYVPREEYVVTAKLPERNGQFEYRIRSMGEDHERMAREKELRALGDGEINLTVVHRPLASESLEEWIASTHTRFQCDSRTGWSSASSFEAKPRFTIMILPSRVSPFTTYSIIVAHHFPRRG